MPLPPRTEEAEESFDRETIETHEIFKWNSLEKEKNGTFKRRGVRRMATLEAEPEQYEFRILGIEMPRS